MRAGICLEDLTGIRGRTTIAKAVRGDHWSFFQLRTFVEYKRRHSRRDRAAALYEPNLLALRLSWYAPGQALACEACGHEADADRNAADDLRLLGMSVMHPGGPCGSFQKETTTGCLQSPRL